MPVVPELDRTHALTAPGQASQAVGKGFSLYLNSEAARSVWSQADKLLGFPFTDLALHGIINGVQLEPGSAKAELTRTENAQPAVIVTSLATLAALEEQNLFVDKAPYWHTGHSVGLVVALVTSGALDPEGAVRLGDARRKAFKLAIDNGPEDGSGFLAVQHDKPEVVSQYVKELIERFSLHVALDNYDNQVVLSGKRRDLDEAIDYVRGVDPKMVNLLAKPPVEAAYHSDFMLLAVDTYSEAVDRIDIQVPTRGVLVAGSMIEDDGTVRILETVADIKTALVRQLTSPERWREIIRFFERQGVVRITELNETPSLVSWNRRMMGGEREAIVLPGVKDPNDKGVVIAWRWNAPS